MEEVPGLRRAPEPPEELVADVTPVAQRPPGFGFCSFSLTRTFLTSSSGSTTAKRGQG